MLPSSVRPVMEASSPRGVVSSSMAVPPKEMLCGALSHRPGILCEQAVLAANSIGNQLVAAA